MIRTRTTKLRPLATLMVTLSFASAAQADPVAIRFGFTSFTSSVESPNTVPVHTFVSGGSASVEVFPVIDTPFTVPFIPSVDSLDFYYDFGSGAQTHNRVWFVPGPPANVGFGDEFLLGTFNLVNGAWFGDADMAFSMVTVSTDPALNGHRYDDVLHFKLNAFNPDPFLSADFFYFSNPPNVFCGGPAGPSLPPACHSVRVYELFDSPILPHVDGRSNGGSIELWGEIGSLIPTGFRNPQGGLFVSASRGSDPSPIVQQPGVVPEPTLLALLSSGLLIAARRAARRTGRPLEADVRRQ